MEKDFEPLKARLRIICDRLDEDEQQFFRPLIDNFKGQTQEFQRIMRISVNLVKKLLMVVSFKPIVKFNICLTMLSGKRVDLY